MRILILDDNPEALFVIENFLKTLGHQPSTFTDGREALLWLKDIRPEIIISDLDMPGIDGFDFIKRLRSMAAFASTPVICMTGTDATDEQIGSGGFAAVLRKPVTLSQVMDSIDLVERSVEAGEREV